MLKDHAIWEFEISFTQETRHYDQCQEYSHTSKAPAKATVRIIADKYDEDVPKALLKSRYKNSGMKVLSDARHDIDGFLISR